MSDQTVVSGSSGSAQHGIECSSCGNANPFGMRFCLTCGRPALYSQMTEKKVGPCPLCGCTDPLNQAFCIACGTALVGEDSPANGKKKRTVTAAGVVVAPVSEVQSAVTVKHKTGFSWEPPAEKSGGSKPESGPRPQPKANPVRSNNFVLPAIASGILFGALLAALLVNTTPAKYVFERLHWPKTGLVVYAQPPQAKVVLENIDTQAVTVAQTQSNGLLSMPSTQPGHYRLFIKTPDSNGEFTEITVLPDRPTVVGFPTPISLTGGAQ